MLQRLLIAVVLLACGVRARADDPPSRDPRSGGEAHTAYAWKSAAGLRFTWCLPEGYDRGGPAHLTVICHGTGLDYRWGHWNNPPGVFRPLDVVVSVDGTSPNGETRLFLGEQDDAQSFRDFLREMRALFRVDQVFLYGHSQGGFFVVYFAGEFPDEVAGVVAHASGAWNWSKTGASARRVALSFMHGTADPVVPYAQSPGARDAYLEARFPMVHLRRLQLYNHWPNAVRATEELDWCQGMQARTAEEALACAARILEPKGADEYQWTTAVGFGAARQVLRRVAGDGLQPFEKASESERARAKEQIDAIEKQAARHVAELRKQLPKGKGLALDGKPWLGHLVALREDFRGVDALEDFVRELGFDALYGAHAKAARAVFDAWYSERPAADRYAEILGALPKCFLYEGFPPGLDAQLEAWRSQERELGVSKRTSKLYADVEAWRTGWDEGRKQYADAWKTWKPRQ